MHRLDLKPGELGELDLCADHSLESVTLSAEGGRVECDIQACLGDSQTFGSPIAGARLKSAQRVVPLKLPETARRLRFTLYNADLEHSATVTVDF